MSSADEQQHLDVITIGRLGIDIYPLPDGLGLENVQAFDKYLGESATNVATAAARHGLRTALITAAGEDPFGSYARTELTRLGVEDRFLATVGGLTTPITCCEMLPPDTFPLCFCREPVARDLMLTSEHLDPVELMNARIYWSTVTGLPRDPSRTTHLEAWNARAGEPLTILDLDYRPMFWSSPDDASRTVRRALGLATVAVGNRDDCEIAVDESDQHRAAEALLDHGVELAIVKHRLRGVLANTRSETIEVPPVLVNVVKRLGAGDGLGGALCYGLPEAWPLERPLTFANVAGALVAGRRECSTAMPTTFEVRQAIKELQVVDT
jgi:5-dehydro-2-deoxygluconokinase